MPYQITLTSGNVYKNIADGTINADSAMVMIGKDFSGYGQYIDQNIIRLLESGANPTRPTAQVLQGELWYDQTNNQLKVAYDAANRAFISASPSIMNVGVYDTAQAGNTSPVWTNSNVGDLWLYKPNANVSYWQYRMRGQGNTAGGQTGNIDADWPVVGPFNNATTARLGTLTLGNALGTDPAGTSGVSLIVLNQANINTLDAGNVIIDTALLFNNNATIFANANSNVSISAPNITSLLNLNALGNGVFAANVTSNNLITTEGTAYIVNQPTTYGNTVSQVFWARNRGNPTQEVNPGLWSAATAVPNAIAYNAGFYGNVYGANYIFGGSIGNTTGRIALGNATALFGVLDSAGGQVQPNITVITSNTGGKRLTNAVFVDDTIAQTAGQFSNVGYYGPQSNVVAKTFIGNLIGSVQGAGGAATAEIDANLITADNIFLPVFTNGSNAAAWIAGNISRANISFPGGTANGDAKFNNLTANSLTVPDGTLDVTGNATFSGYVQITGNLVVLGNTTFSNQANTVTNNKVLILADNTTNANAATSLFESGITIGSVSNIGTTAATLLYYPSRTALEINKAFSINPTANTTGGGLPAPTALNVNGNIVARTAGTAIYGNISGNASASNSYFANIYIGGGASIFNSDTTGGTDYQASTTRSYVPALGAFNLQYTDLGSAQDWASASQLNVGNTIVVRAANGYMYGTATSALYADLAERYLLDAEYPAGTLVQVGGTAEATASTEDGTPFGIVSTQPGFLMNEGLVGGTYIALKGRVPTRVVGTIRKGDKIGPSAIPGVGTTNTQNYMAIALQSYDSPTEGTIEAIVL